MKLSIATVGLTVMISSIAGHTLSSATAQEIEETPITDADREHWSFEPLVRPALPPVDDAHWSANPIDRFVLARMQVKQLTPQPPADRTTLLRRVTLDLTGLPPTVAQVEAFLADNRPDAYQRVVERLLASPAFGEHYAQQWLDLARWAETDGFEHDKMRDDAWRYRDWVIEALNRDLPYDQFVSLQLAGDELRPGDRWATAATGFCLAGPDMPDINLKAERRDSVLNDIAGTVGAVFLGLQVGCAQCHDHKFDPISQADFYRLRAIFDPAVDFKSHVFREGKPSGKPNFLYQRGDFRRPGPEVDADFPRIANVWDAQLSPPPEHANSSQRRLQLAQWLTRSDHPLTSRVEANRLWQAHFGRGLSETPSDFGVMGDQPIHDDLLDWLAVELVEHDWSRKHVHRLIVTSATYRQASHPREAHDPHWQATLQHDPRNLYWSRYPRRRLTGETIRDSMLAVSDTLNRQRQGPSVRPPLPKEVVQTLLRADHWQVSRQREDHYRRSIYVFARRNLRFPFFEAFDRPAATASCPRRNTSTIAPQSLMLLNSEFSLEMARRLAGSAMASTGENQPAQVDLIVRRLLGRTPTKEERSEALAFLQMRVSASTDPIDSQTLPLPLPENASPKPAAALVDFCLAMLNASEFVYLE